MTAATPGQATGLLEQLHALAAKWDAKAASNQRNGQSLLDQGDEYGNEGLATAEAFDACHGELTALLAAQQPQPAPELRAALAETRQLRDLADEITRTFLPSGSGHVSRVGQVQIAKWRKRAGLES